MQTHYGWLIINFGIKGSMYIVHCVGRHAAFCTWKRLTETRNTHLLAYCRIRPGVCEFVTNTRTRAQALVFNNFKAHKDAPYLDRLLHKTWKYGVSSQKHIVCYVPTYVAVMAFHKVYFKRYFLNILWILVRI